MFEKNQNTLSKVLFILGVGIIILGVFFGMIYSSANSSDGTVDWSVALPIFVTGIVSGLVFLGFSEIIRLLQNISNGINKDKVIESTETTIHTIES